MDEFHTIRPFSEQVIPFSSTETPCRIEKVSPELILTERKVL